MFIVCMRLNGMKWPIAVVQLLSLWHPMDDSTPGLLVLHYQLELAQTHVQRVDDAM